MWMSRTLSGTTGRTILLGLAVIAVIFAINYRYPSVLGGAELIAGDLRMQARGESKPTGSVVIVAIDDESISKIGQWPWPRAVLGELITALGNYNVAVIGMDLLFPGRPTVQIAIIR